MMETEDNQTLYNETFIDMEEILRNTDEHKATVILYIYFLPVIMFMAIIVNILSCVILRRLPLIKTNLGIYLYIYCVMNMVVLMVEILPAWIAEMAQVPAFQYRHNWLCKSWQLIKVLIKYPPQWLVALMSLDLFIMIFYPQNVQKTSTQFLAKTKVVGVYTILVFINVHSSYTFLLNEKQHCVVQMDFMSVPLYTVLPYVSAVINTYLPLTILAICIVANCGGMLLVEISETAKCVELYCVTMALNTVFFLLTTPQIVMNLVTFSQPLELMSIPEIAVKYQLANHVCKMIDYANLCVIFFVFISCVPDFWNELMNMVGFRKQRQTVSIEMDEESRGHDDGTLITESQI